jgi:hypothetical protein
VPSYLLLDLRGTNSIARRSLELELELEEEEIYLMSSILIDISLRRGNSAGNADASRRRRVINIKRLSTKGSLYT